MFHQDWIMRQVEGMAQMLAKMIFGKSDALIEFEEQDDLTDADHMYLRLIEYLQRGEINAAEDFLWEFLDGETKRYFEFALDFYAKLNKMEPAYLAEHDFSRDEIQQGLQEAAKLYGIDIENLMLEQ